MLADIITKLICEDEDEYHDFKEEWYVQNKKDEMIKDIFSFVNTAHHHDCYLIMGVKNDLDHTIVGIENDKNRYNTQKLTDYLGYLPIANCETPVVRVGSLPIEQHTIDVIIIKDFNQVPVYLTKQYRPKKCENIIQPGQIFCRLNDTNTAINQTAKDYQVRKLWKKRFRLDLSPIEQYKYKLSDITNWEYSEDGEKRFLYEFDPDYCMYLVDDIDKASRYKIQSYSLSQNRARVNWETLNLMYKDRLIKSFTVVYLDQYRFLTVYPQESCLESSYNSMLVYRFILADSIDFYVEKFLLNQKNAFSPSPDSFQKDKLLKSIVVFKDIEQKNNIDKELKKDISVIRKEVKPKSSQLNSIQKKVKLEFNYEDEVSINEITAACQEFNLGAYINDSKICKINEVNSTL